MTLWKRQFWSYSFVLESHIPIMQQARVIEYVELLYLHALTELKNFIFRLQPHIKNTISLGPGHCFVDVSISSGMENCVLRLSVMVFICYIKKKFPNERDDV